MDGMRTSANLLSLTHLFPSLGNGPAYFARRLLGTPSPSTTGGFDEAVVALLRWTSKGSMADLAALPHRAVYAAKQVAVARSGWSSSDSYLGVKVSNAAASAQKLDQLTACGGCIPTGIHGPACVFLGQPNTFRATGERQIDTVYL
jgi:hypothetical protein